MCILLQDRWAKNIKTVKSRHSNFFWTSFGDSQNVIYLGTKSIKWKKKKFYKVLGLQKPLMSILNRELKFSAYSLQDIGISHQLCFSFSRNWGLKIIQNLWVTIAISTNVMDTVIFATLLPTAIDFDLPRIISYLWRTRVLLASSMVAKLYPSFSKYHQNIKQSTLRHHPELVGKPVTGGNNSLHIFVFPFLTILPVQLYV